MTPRFFKTVRSVSLERGFLAVMIIVSGILAVLQYRWTDRLAREELAGEQTLLERRAQTFAQTFDRELSGLCLQLVPPERKIATDGLNAANLSAYRNWSVNNSPAIFRHVAIVEPVAEGIRVYEINALKNRLDLMNPPATWAPLLQNLLEKRKGNSPPFEDANGVLLEFPVMDTSVTGGNTHSSIQ